MVGTALKAGAVAQGSEAHGLAALEAQPLVGFARIVGKLAVGLKARVAIEFGGTVHDAVLTEHHRPMAALVKAAEPDSAHLSALRALGNVAHVVQERV